MSRKQQKHNTSRDFHYSPTGDYPSAWFRRNPGKKPVIFIDTNRSLNKLRDLVICGLTNNNLQSEVATSYLWTVFAAHSHKIDEGWSSFRVKIATKNQDVTVAALFKLLLLNESAEDYEVIVPPVRLSEKDDLWLVIYLCAVYRIMRDDKQNDGACRSINAKLTAQEAPENFRRIQSLFGHYCNWFKDKNFVKLVAGIDMYLVRFPEHIFKDARLCTNTARHKNCAALLEVTYLSEELLKMDVTELKKWIWEDQVLDDFRRLLKPGEEVGKKYSYAPYMMDLYLSNKSPYSVTVNPKFHLFTHIVGCAAGFERSMKAKAVGEFIEFPIKSNAEIVAYANVNLPVKIPDGDLKELTDKITANEYWFAVLTKDGCVPPKISGVMNEVWSKFAHSPKDTIAKRLCQLR